MAAAAAAEESMSMAALAMSVPDSTVGSPRAEGEGVGVAREEKDATTKGTEAFGDSEEDGDDVFEVEKILDMKCEGGKNLYKVRWKGYTSDDDTWEPEIHLEDCKEVLLEFRKKVAENKAKAIKKDIQRLSLSNDIFEADFDSDQQSDTKEDTSPRKKKKKIKCKEEKSPDDLKKKKAKLGKLKDKFKSELESTSENLGFDIRTKKRILEAKEELKDSKKLKKDEIKENKELKKAKRAEIRDLKFKIREDIKDNRKTKKERSIECPLEFESPVPNESLSPEDDGEDFVSDNKEEKQKIRTVKDKAGQDTVQEGIFEKHLDDLVSTDEDAGARVRRKKKKPRIFDETKEIKKLENMDTFLERKMIPKKQRYQDKSRNNLELSRLPSPMSIQAPKSSRLSGEEKGLRSSDSAEEEKDTKKNESKEKYQKKYDLDKEEKCRKEPKGLKYGRQQILSLGMDLQLEWMKLEDFQKHLDGEDETFTTTNTIPSNLLRDAVKNGDYIAVKVALNSNEEYNLDQEACKRGNSDIVRLVIECGADCNILSKHQNSALYFAKQCNNVLVYELLKSHLETLSRVAEETIRDYFESRLALLEPVFPIACHRLCEGPDFSTDFNYKPPQNIPEGSGVLLFIFHANFLGKEVIARLCGPCSVQAVVLNDKFQLPVFLDSHFVYSFSPVAGPNKLFIRLTEAPFAKVKLLIGAYRVQLH
ncbi:M-phase phosphoprotein 8 [Cricetulus griseus]